MVLRTVFLVVSNQVEWVHPSIDGVDNVIVYASTDDYSKGDYQSSKAVVSYLSSSTEV